MTGRRVRIFLATAVVGVGFAASALNRGHSYALDVLVIGGLIAFGEFVTLGQPGRTPLPLSFALFVVLVRAADPSDVLPVLVAAELTALLLRLEPTPRIGEIRSTVERIAEGMAAAAVYVLVLESSGDRDTRAATLVALALAAAAPILVSDIANWAQDHVLAGWRRRSADLAVVAGGILMAVGYAGIDGKGAYGLWGILLFGIPLLAAWYSFSLAASARRNYEQTVQALAATPELAGLVRRGHAERVASLCESMARELSFTDAEVEQVTAAALLHHLGAVCLDEPPPGQPLDASAVAAASANMLRATDALAPAGDVIAGESLLHRPPDAGAGPPATVAAQVLKVASAFDELTEGADGHASWAVEALYTGPGYVYDGRVLDALERALERRGVLRAAV